MGKKKSKQEKFRERQQQEAKKPNYRAPRSWAAQEKRARDSLERAHWADEEQASWIKQTFTRWRLGGVRRK